MVSLHWDLERELAARLIATTAESRGAVFADAYSELYRSTPWLKQAEAVVGEAEWATKYSYLHGLLPPAPADVLEVGSGGGGLIAYLSRAGYRCTATDVTDQRADLLIRQCPGLRWVVADAIWFADAVPPASQSVVISDQVVEHLHPDDVPLHLAAVWRALRPGGRYVLRVPHATAGPGDLSQVFGAASAQGMHLKEYTYREIRLLGRAAGFDRIEGYLLWPDRLRPLAAVFRRAVAGPGVLGYLRSVEAAAELLPRRLARTAFLALTLSKNVCAVLHKAA
ncbi:MAG: class I SAM-dependent methyltransferase [Verrucomicrobiota bacterium]